MVRQLFSFGALFFTTLILLSCGSTSKPTTGVDPSQYELAQSPIRVDGGKCQKSSGELYGKITVQPKVGQPFLVDEFVIFYDDRNLVLDNPQCGLVDESGKEYWFDQAYQSTEESDGNYFNEKLVNLYSCVVTAPSAGQYRFTVRYDTNDRGYVGPDQIISYSPFTVLP